jgi:hypothetical protein
LGANGRLRIGGEPAPDLDGGALRFRHVL